MSNATYSALPTSEGHTKDTLPTYFVSSRTHASSLDIAAHPPLAAQETPLPEHLCAYTVSCPFIYESDGLIAERGSSKQDIVNKLRPVCTDILARATVDRIAIQISVDGQWSTVPDSSFDEVVIRGRPNRIKLLIQPSFGMWVRTNRLPVCCIVVFLSAFFLFMCVVISIGTTTQRHHDTTQ